MEMRTIVCCAAFAIAALGVPGNAAIINGELRVGENDFEDTDYERLVNAGADNTLVEVGDTLEAVGYFQNLYQFSRLK
jgi:hypothetical protein